jgi:hypothetical protein
VAGGVSLVRLRGRVPWAELANSALERRARTAEDMYAAAGDGGPEYIQWVCDE